MFTHRGDSMRTFVSALRQSFRVAGLSLLLGFSSAAVLATPVNLGYLSFDASGTTATFDIANITGVNSTSLNDPAFPVVTPVTLSGLSLLVHLSDGTSETFTQSDFTLALDGLSYDGPSVAIGGSVLPISAILTGNLSPTTLDIGSSVSVDAAFLPVTLTDVTGGPLQDGDAALIQANPGSTSTVPEPSTLSLMTLGALAALRARRRLGVSAALATAAAVVPGMAGATTVGMTTATLPSTGVAGVSSVKLTANGLPNVAAASIHIAIAPTCAVGGSVAGEIDTVASKVTAFPFSTVTKSISFTIPGTVAQGTYLVSISGTDTGGTPFASTGCSAMTVTTTNTTLNACLPTSSLAVALGTHVTAYVPRGYWEGSTTGVQVVPIEGGGAPSLISTPHVVNSCASNPASGETICTANNTDVYRITGTTLTGTVTSGATGTASFSGGNCANCGVAINALTNTAYINMGISGSPSGGGLQALNLTTGTLGPAFKMQHLVSENISIDAGRGLVLSPGEDGNYGLVKLDAAGGLVAEYANTTIGGGTDYDSAAEDCTTGVALASSEFTSNVPMADLNQATFVAGSGGSIGTWSSPHAVVPLSGSFSAGTSGISVAPGSAHLGVVTGEFGGQAFAVMQLPTTPATGGTVPGITDYVYVPNLPNTPDGTAFSAGFDPHTITAYTSPNDGKPYALIADWATGTPTYVAVIDLQALMAAPRLAGSHTLNTGAFNLLTSGAVRYVKTS
jgi:hypothetical protein